MWVFLITQMFPMAILIVPIYTIMASLGPAQHLGRRWSSPTARRRCRSAPGCCKGYFDTIPMRSTRRRRSTASTPFGTFWRLILPLARPGLAVTAFYTFLTAWGEVAYATRS